MSTEMQQDASAKRATSEKKIDLIGDRLVSIEKLLKQQHGRQPENENPTRSAESLLTPSSITTATASPNSSNVDATFGAATAGTHSAAASTTIEQAVGKSPGVYQDAELATALASLKDMVSQVDEAPSSTDLSSFQQERGDCAAPTEVEITQLQAHFGGSITLAFSPGLTVAELKDKCDSVFKYTTPRTTIRRLYVYGVLRFLCQERGGLDGDPAFAQRCKDLSRFFTAKIGEALGDLRMIVPATAEAAAALIMVAGSAESPYKPHLARTLSSHAASIVLSLGYHRISTMQSDPEPVRQSKILLFWMVYWVDSSFSIHLGREPVIRHYDVTVPRISHGSVLPSSFVDAFNYCIRVSSLKCQIVEQLYSPLALQQPLNDRRKRASKLMEQINEVWALREGAPASVADDIDADHVSLYILMRTSDAVSHYSTIALIQHATISSASEESPALDSARKALNLNIDAWRLYGHFPDFIWSGHCYWTLLKAPLTPFTVVFGHIIAHPFNTHDDLQLLADWVETLKQLRRFSGGMVKLHKLCDIFCKVAALYVRAKGNETSTIRSTNGAWVVNADSHMLAPQYQDHAYNNAATMDFDSDWIGQPAVNDIDQYLSTFGLAPTGTANGYGMSGGDFDPSFLNDWYQANGSLMGFLEQDLLFPEGQMGDFVPGAPG
ncbi:uncharacterized protein LTR77_008126 [Saxophila tyrrhenica]|uniref:Xylanolytic transcriptional activator regulatory domain-containing protein n=1 Tax=Saxophila tyrrhenica TaxID=1690608 RepID=A0AAV9P4X0_9PEZI|nr:hypothetical protein LTR77_008126 [Saxophila tyrrhenica]